MSEVQRRWEKSEYPPLRTQYEARAEARAIKIREKVDLEISRFRNHIIEAQAAISTIESILRDAQFFDKAYKTSLIFSDLRKVYERVVEVKV